VASLPQLALKIDVDTHVGLRDGVPELARILEARGCRASFFISCGPDHSGRAIRRVFRRGFLAKMLRTRAPGLYGWRTLLYGTLLPGPLIAPSFPDRFRSLAAQGHEVGVHGYDHVYWHDRLSRLADEEVERELRRGLKVYRQIMGSPPDAFAAPGWQCTAASLAAIDRAGLLYHSDTRGVGPYRPRVSERIFLTPEIPTTWPTLDEVYGREGSSALELVRFFRGRLRPGLNVHTVHAELEGMAHREFFRVLLDALLPELECVRLTDVAARLQPEALPVCGVVPGNVPGRAGTVALQEGAE